MMMVVERRMGEGRRHVFSGKSYFCKGEGRDLACSGLACIALGQKSDSGVHGE